MSIGSENTNLTILNANDKIAATNAIPRAIPAIGSIITPINDKIPIKTATVKIKPIKKPI
jgi:hypothetical protein